VYRIREHYDRARDVRDEGFGMSKRKHQPECSVVVEESDGPNGCDMFIVLNGQKIARRGYPDTQQALTWIALEPGFAVYDTPDGIVIEQNGPHVH
jgi:hypothetical protein